MNISNSATSFFEWTSCAFVFLNCFLKSLTVYVHFHDLYTSRDRLNTFDTLSHCRCENGSMLFLIISIQYSYIFIFQSFSWIFFCSPFFSYRIVFGNRKHILFISVYFKAVIFYTLLFTPCASHFSSTWCSSVALQIAGGIIFNTLHLQCSYLCSASLCWILMSFVAAVAQLKFHLVVCLMDDYLDAVLFFSTLS